MKITINENYKTFKFLIGILSSVGTETKMKFAPEGVKMVASLGGTTVIETSFKADFFDTYEVNGEEEFGVMFKDLNTPIQKFTPPLTITDVDNRFIISSTKGEYKMPVLEDVSMAYADLPQFTHTFSVDNLKLNDFTEAVNLVSATGSRVVTFYTENNKLMAKSVNGTREMTTELVDVENEMADKLFLTVDLLKPILLKTQDEVRVCLEKDKPLVVHYDSNGASMRFVVAPRVDDGN